MTHAGQSAGGFNGRMHDELLAALRAGRPAAAVGNGAPPAPTVPAPDARSVRVLVNGVALHVVQAGPPDGPLVLLLHGCPEFWWGWRHQIGALARAGFLVWAPDQRGYGGSDRPARVQDYRIDTLAEDAAGLVAAAGRQAACVVGHDWGGGVAWWLALHRPELVTRLAVLNAPHPLAFRRALLTSPRQMLRSWYMALFALPRVPELLFSLRDGELMARALRNGSRPGTFTEEVLRPYRASWARPGALRGMFHWYRALVGQRGPRAERVRVPTLLIWGARDVSLGRELAQPSIERCALGRLQLLETATHWLHHEEPTLVNELLRAHLCADFPTEPPAAGARPAPDALDAQDARVGRAPPRAALPRG
jgi:epoxide hydrolase 4